MEAYAIGKYGCTYFSLSKFLISLSYCSVLLIGWVDDDFDGRGGYARGNGGRSVRRSCHSVKLRLRYRSLGFNQTDKTSQAELLSISLGHRLCTIDRRGRDGYASFTKPRDIVLSGSSLAKSSILIRYFIYRDILRSILALRSLGRPHYKAGQW